MAVHPACRDVRAKLIRKPKRIKRKDAGFLPAPDEVDREREIRQGSEWVRTEKSELKCG